MTQWLGAALVAVGIIGVWATGASPSLGAGEDPALLLDDPGFSAVTLESMGRWEVRYAIKDSDPASRPRWHVVPRLDDGDPAHAQHLSVEEYGPAAGRVLIGRRIQLPRSIEGLEFSLDFIEELINFAHVIAFAKTDGRKALVTHVLWRQRHEFT